MLKNCELKNIKEPLDDLLAHNLNRLQAYNTKCELVTAWSHIGPDSYSSTFQQHSHNYKVQFKFGTDDWPYINEHLEKSLYAQKPIYIFVDSFPSIKKQPGELFMYLQVESPCISGHITDMVYNSYDLFDKILTWDPKLLEKSNAIKFMPNNKVYWVQPPLGLNNRNLLDQPSIDYSIQNKQFKVTMLCGDKVSCSGHILRRAIWDNQEKITIPKEFYHSQSHDGLHIFAGNRCATDKKNKTELLYDAMFHIAIENNRSVNYFTEKLIDCIVSKTIPIYYGCTNISDYFDTRGFIIIKNTQDINRINKLTADYYNKTLPYIEENYSRWLALPSFKKTDTITLEYNKPQMNHKSCICSNWCGGLCAFQVPLYAKCCRYRTTI